MLVACPWPVALAIDAGLWVGWGVAVGWWTAHRPRRGARRERMAPSDPPLRGGRGWYERVLHVRAWKDRLPEAGTWFGGLSKRHLPTAAEGGLGRYRAECVRAELTHVLALAIVPLFVLWTPWWLFVVLALGGLACNLPCVVAPRYNRARIDALQIRRAQAGRA